MDNELDSEREATIQAALDEPNYLLRERTFGYSEGDVRWLLDTMRHERAENKALTEVFEVASVVVDYWHNWRDGVESGIARLKQAIAKAQAPTGDADQRSPEQYGEGIRHYLETVGDVQFSADIKRITGETGREEVGG